MFRLRSFCKTCFLFVCVAAAVISMGSGRTHVHGRRISDASVMAGQLALAHTAADQGHSATPHSQLTVSPACVLPLSCMHTPLAGYTGKVRFVLMQQLLYEGKAATQGIFWWAISPDLAIFRKNLWLQEKIQTQFQPDFVAR
jgi:hypothetical protein